jgi:isocitrate/isopropylmalate dehydrogenase
LDLLQRAYVRIRQHTSAHVSIRQTYSFGSAPTRIRPHSSAFVSIRQHTSAYVSIRQTYSFASAPTRIRPHTSAYVSLRQHTSVYVSLRQYTSAYVRHIHLHLLPRAPTHYLYCCTSKASKVGYLQLLRQYLYFVVLKLVLVKQVKRAT